MIDWFHNLYKEKAGIRWGIALKRKGNIIGTIGFNNFIKNHRANIGFDLQAKFWNRGIITEALKTVVEFGFIKFGINRSDAEVMQGNDAQDKVLSKIGF